MYHEKLTSMLKNHIHPLSANDTVDTALNLMRINEISSIVIVDSFKKPIGIFTERDSLRIIANKALNKSLLSEVMTSNVFTIPIDVYIHDAYVLMEQKGFRHLIVVDAKGIFRGVITEGDFLRHMGFEEAIQDKNISEAMSESILTIDNNTSIIQTAELMSNQKCDYAIVLQEKIPKAIVTEREITLYCSQNIIHSDTNISAISQYTLHTIDKNRSLQEASSLMQGHSVHQLIVINDKKELIGLLTRHDILKAVHGAYFDFLLRTIDDKTKKEQMLQEQAKKLKKLANFDILTDLPNRLLFKKLLKNSIANAIRHKHFIAIAIFDIDRFRDINDSYGHKIGDELLQKIAKIFIDQTREGDFVSRLGGNEFSIILGHIEHEKSIPHIINKLLKAITKPIKLSNATEVSVQSCAGVIIAPKDSQDVDHIIQYANSALHQAKKEGHGIYKFYTDKFIQESIQKIAYENALRNAIEKKELELYYQAQVHIKTEKIIGAEALLRWKTQDGQMIPPDIFIPIAEETGLINEIGEWVLFEACKQGKKFLDAGYHITIAVNVSANQVKYQNLPALVSQALLKYNYDPNKLEIEITESALMQREEEVVEMLHSLRDKGIKLAIDDFGTGYSSLAYLKRFPIDVLKIDKSFVDYLPHEDDDCAIVTAIIEMGKALGYQVLAEGTEKQEQLDFLKEKGCNIYQGYIKSKAVSANEFEELLRAQNA